MKKLVSIISALTIAASVCAPVLAENNNEEMKSILAGVKERVEIPAECTEFSSGSRSEYGITTYDFLWRTKNVEAGEYKNVRVLCLDDGTITSYSTTSDSRDYSLKISRLTKDEAKERAEDFIKRMNPDFPYAVVVNDEGAGNLYGNYNFSTQVYINEIPIDGTGRIAVDGDSGRISNYYLNYMPAEYPSVEEAISVEDAKKAYSEKLGLKLVYKTYMYEEDNKSAYPAYVQKQTGEKYINALTGELADLTDNRYARYTSGSGGGAAFKTEEAAADNGFTEQELSELENVKGLVSKEKIEQQLRANTTLNIPSEVKLSNISLTKRYNKDEYTYNVSMNSDTTYIHASLDAKTGELLSYSRSDKDDDSKTEYRNDRAVEALAGNKSDEYKYNDETNNYQRYVNDIAVEGDTLSLNYRNGILTHYYISYTDIEFPSIDDVISVADAEKIMFDKNGYNMAYKLSYSEESITPVAVYVHNYININALTGKIVGYDGEEITDSKIEYSDIDDHYAKQIIETLAYYGIGFEGGEFKPNEKITQKDYIQLLTAITQSPIVILKNDNSQYESAYSSAIRRNILSKDERDDNAIVTRETAAIYMMRTIGAEPYAKYDDIYTTPFKDVTRNKGYIALLSAMGIASGNGDGTFTPEREITRAESAVMIYNYLTRQ